MPFAATWMDLEIVILSEVSQTEKDKNKDKDIAYTWNLKKWYKRTYLQNRNRRRKQPYGYQGGKEGRDKLGDRD